MMLQFSFLAICPLTLVFIFHTTYRIYWTKMWEVDENGQNHFAPHALIFVLPSCHGFQMVLSLLSIGYTTMGTIGLFQMILTLLLCMLDIVKLCCWSNRKQQLYDHLYKIFNFYFRWFKIHWLPSLNVSGSDKNK